MKKQQPPSKVKTAIDLQRLKPAATPNATIKRIQIAVDPPGGLVPKK